MPYVHSVTSDDDLDELEVPEAPPGERRPIPWIPIASAAGAVVLLIVLVIMLTGRGGSTPPPVGTSDTPGAAGTPLVASDPRVEAVQQALSAWGSFEGSGNVNDLGTTMATDGPQYKALAARAGTVAAGTKPFVVEVTNPKRMPVDADDREVVRADLVWKRAGKPDKSVTWDVVLITEEGKPGYQLWTAKLVTAPSNAGGSGTATGTGAFCNVAKQAAAIPTISDTNARIDQASSDDAKLAIVRDVVQQRSGAMSQLADSAPNEIKAKVQTAATADASYSAQVQSASSLAALDRVNKQFAKNSTYIAGEKARPDVYKFVQQQCGIDINPAR